MIIGAAPKNLDTEATEEHQDRLAVLRENRAEPLREYVRNALTYYLKSLDGHEVNDLHEMVMGEVELPLIETVLDYTQGNQTRAARLLGLSRSTLRKKMAHYEVRRRG